jgi:hypothetical protein
MVGSAARVLACARAVDAGRRTAKGRRAGCPSPFGGWRSGAAERVQASAGVAESAIDRRRPRAAYGEVVVVPCCWVVAGAVLVVAFFFGAFLQSSTT